MIWKEIKLLFYTHRIIYSECQFQEGITFPKLFYVSVAFNLNAEGLCKFVLGLRLT